MKLFRVLVLGVALAAGGIAAYLALNMGPSAAPGPTVVELAPSIQSQDVLVASADIGQGEKLTAENVRWQRWPDEAINPTYIQKQSAPDALDKLKGAVVRSQFIAGEPIREAKLARADSGFLAAILPQGKRAIAVRVSAQNTAGGFILPNDRVDVVQTISQQTSPDVPAQTVSRTILTNVKVLAIDQSVEQLDGGGGEGEEGESGGESVVVGKTATLELDPVQVELITAAETSGTLSLALRSIEDAGDATATFEPKAPASPIVAPLPSEDRTSSTIRIIRGGRLQETTIGLVPGEAQVAPAEAQPAPVVNPASGGPETLCTATAKADGEFSATIFTDCMEQAASEDDQG